MEDIELIRQWRNSDPVRLNMQYQALITSEQQVQWFNSINNVHNNYMLIHYQGDKIGLLNDKNIDWEALTSESGIFLGKTALYSTFVPYLISVAGIETTFFFLGWKRQFAHILRTNTNAIRFNQELGYQLCEGQEQVDHQKYELTRERFELKAGKIRKSVRSLAGSDTRSRVLFEEPDYQSGVAQRFERLLQGCTFPIEREECTEGVWFREVADGPGVK